MPKKIIMLTGPSESSTFMYNGLKKEFDIQHVIIEEVGSRKKFIKRRIKKLGYITVFGQLLFKITIPKILGITSQKRIQEIKTEYNLDNIPIPDSKSFKVTSVNNNKCIDFIKKVDPDIIIVNGTRIISKKVLDATNALFVNTHAGITPKYRGVHGAYWAQVHMDKNNCGVTVHLVDSGIDTGGVLLQKTINTVNSDNFKTYTYIQIGEGIRLMKQVLTDFIHSDLKEKESISKESNLWYHPTLWGYLYNRVTKGVK